MARRTRITTGRGEVWMLVRDPQKLATLMALANVSARQLSEAAGWKSHSYLTRILRGEVRTLRIEPAARIAHRLGVGVDDLFLTRVTSNAGQNDNVGAAA